VRVAIVRFPGSNCDGDLVHAVTRVLGQKGDLVWHKDVSLPACDVVMLPGGFAYGDYLRAGAIAACSPIMGAVKEFAGKGGPLLGVCNGFQVLCEAGLLPGALTRNASLRFECREVHIRVEGKPTPFTDAIAAGRALRIPIAHAEGRYVHDDPAALAAAGQIVFRYCDAAGGLEGDGINPNGSIENIAGVANERGNVVGLMPHPERVAEAVLGGEDGRAIFESVLAWVQRGHKGRASA
jgi:phosphoribosylformylglycinamidine synthase